MKADPFQIGDVLKNPKRFVLPIYQRTYAWKTQPHLETFFDQVEAKAGPEDCGVAELRALRLSRQAPRANGDASATNQFCDEWSVSSNKPTHLLVIQSVRAGSGCCRVPRAE
jgi:hypothetical protein